MPAWDKDDLDELVERLLGAAEHVGHPLREPLARLYARSREQLALLEKITRISDTSYSLARSDTLSLNDRFEKQVRRLEKIAHISDRYQRMLSDVNEALRKASTHDALTGLPNRRLLNERLRQETDRANRLGEPYGLAMLDLDHFKRVNDRFGHDAGDGMLILIAQTLQSALRDYDVCGRWGGEEFLILLPGTGLAEARMVVERVSQAIRSQGLSVGEAAVPMTASFGLTEHRPGETVDDTVKRADDALLEAKRAGRDRVQIG